jgi:TP901 family phage tail tape measure protein
MAITAAELQVKIGADTTDADQAMQSVSGRLSSFGAQAGMVGGLLTAGITLPLVGVAKTALSTAIDYQSALNMMQAVSGATDAQMAQVAATATALGADMSLPATSAADAALAMTELAKAGLSVEQSMAAAQGVLQLAAAGGLSEAQAAEIAANALNAFGLSGEKATDVADLLAAAANASSADVGDLADALKMSSSVFAAAGMPLEELVAAIGQMANAGIKGSDAGTSLKQMLLSLQAPSDKARQLMADLGITIYDTQGQMLPLPQIIDQFSTRLAGLSQEQRNAALATIFGSDAVRAANIVLMAGADAHAQMLQAVTRQGAAADLATARMKGLGGAIEGLKSQIETVLLSAAQPFLGTLEGWVRGLADLVPRIAAIDPALRTAALAFAAVLAAAGPALVVFGAVSAAIGFLLSPIGLVVIAIAALAAAWATNFGGIRDLTASVLTAVSNAIQTVIRFVSPFIQREIGVVVGWWQANWPLIQRTVETVMTTIHRVVTNVLTGVQQIWQTHGTTITAIVQSAWIIITTTIDTALKLVLNLMTLVMQVITGDWRGAWTTIQTILRTVWDGIVAIVKATLTGLVALLALAWAGIKAAAQSTWSSITADVGRAWDTLKAVVGASASWIVTTLAKAWSSVASTAGSAWRGVADTIAGIWSGLVNTVRGHLNRLIDALNGLVRGWNALQFRIPGFSVDLPAVDVPGVGRVGGGRLGWDGLSVSVPNLATIPRLAEGGIVTRPTIAMIGEAGPEAVVPLRSAGVTPITVNISVAGSVIAERDLAARVREELLRLGRRNLSVGLA